jgi:hypothetical protein
MATVTHFNPPPQGEGDQRSWWRGLANCVTLAEAPLHPALRARSPSPYRGGCA